MRVALLVFVALLFTCGSPYVSPYYTHGFYDQFPPPYSYDYHPNATTPEGIRVDTSGEAVDLADLDRRVDFVESCLAGKFGSPPALPPSVVSGSQCDSTTFPLPLLRRDLQVKVAANWVWSCDHTQELIPVPSPDSGCVAKGLTPTPECPCYWRVGIQGNQVIVVTPDLHMLQDSVTRMATGCNDVWMEGLSACAQPL